MNVEVLVSSIDGLSGDSNISKEFIGVILLPIASNVGGMRFHFTLLGDGQLIHQYIRGRPRGLIIDERKTCNKLGSYYRFSYRA